MTEDELNNKFLQAKTQSQLELLRKLEKMKEHFLTGFIGFEHTTGKTRKLSMPAEDSHEHNDHDVIATALRYFAQLPYIIIEEAPLNMKEKSIPHGKLDYLVAVTENTGTTCFLSVHKQATVPVVIDLLRFTIIYNNNNLESSNMTSPAMR